MSEHSSNDPGQANGSTDDAAAGGPSLPPPPPPPPRDPLMPDLSGALPPPPPPPAPPADPSEASGAAYPPPAPPPPAPPADPSEAPGGVYPAAPGGPESAWESAAASWRSEAEVPPPPPPPGGEVGAVGQFDQSGEAGEGAEGGNVPWQVPNPTPPWPSSDPDSGQVPVAPEVASPPGGWPAAPGGSVPPPGAVYGAPVAPPVPGPPPAPAPGYGAPAAPGYGPPPGPPPGPAPGYGPPPGVPGPPGYGAPPGPPGIQIVDPHGIGHAVGRLGSGAKRAGKIAFAVLGAVLEPDDVVEIVVQGRLHGVPGAAALVGTKLVLVNERQWKPDVVVLTIGNALQVQGWQDERTASVLLTVGGQQEVIERIPDRLLAVEFAQRIRERIGQVAAQVASEPPAQ